jgi:hypothetical protein
MKIVDKMHHVHFEAVRMEKAGHLRNFPAEDFGKGATQKVFVFDNGYGASVVNGFMSFGLDELAVLIFDNPVKPYRSRKKRLRKKYAKKVGNYSLTYDTPITSDVKRYDDHKELQRDLNRIARLK